MMKKILVTGANSYIGTSFKKWLGVYEDEYLVHTVDMIDGTWRYKEFSCYDIIFHVAGIAHIKETNKNVEIFYKVNRDMAYEVAKKAKTDGVKQFIFLSSMSVYGLDKGVITKATIPSPTSNYGKSKLQAEELIFSLEDDRFKIGIIRAPMIYGKGCRGNYNRLENFALKSPIFPYIKNQRSMIYIDNLCEFVKLLIDDYSRGIFFPQNNEYICTSEMVNLIAENYGKKIFLTKIFTPFLRGINIKLINKVFGDLIYDKEISKYPNDYCIYNLKESIKNIVKD